MSPSTTLTVSLNVLWGLRKNDIQLERSPVVSERVFSPKYADLPCWIGCCAYDLWQNGPTWGFWQECCISHSGAPRVKKEDVQLEVRNGQLTVSAETKESVEHSESGYAVRERRFGKFSRSLRLPKGVKVSIPRNELISFVDGLLGWKNQSGDGWWSVECYVPSVIAWAGPQEN